MDLVNRMFEKSTSDCTTMRIYFLSKKICCVLLTQRLEVQSNLHQRPPLYTSHFFWWIVHTFILVSTYLQWPLCSVPKVAVVKVSNCTVANAKEKQATLLVGLQPTRPMTRLYFFVTKRFVFLYVFVIWRKMNGPVNACHSFYLVIRCVSIHENVKHRN